MKRPRCCFVEGFVGGLVVGALLTVLMFLGAS